jgi:hypothetical protein
MYNETLYMDICSNRHNDNPESTAAFESIKAGLPTARAMVFEMIIEAGPGGLASQEITDNLGVGVNVISCRVTELFKGRG